MILLDPHTPQMISLQSPKTFQSTSSPFTPTSTSLKEPNLDGSEIASSDTVPSSIGEDAPHNHSGNTLKSRETVLDRETTNATLRLSTENLASQSGGNILDGASAPKSNPGNTCGGPNDISQGLAGARAKTARSLHPDDPHARSDTKETPSAAKDAAVAGAKENPAAFSKYSLAAAVKADIASSSTSGARAAGAVVAARPEINNIRRHTSPVPWSVGRVSSELNNTKRSTELTRTRSPPTRIQQRAKSSLELENLRRQSTQNSANAEINRMRNSILAKRNIQKRRRDFAKEDQVCIGNKITEGHQNFVMAYNMLTGIRVAVSRCSGVMKLLDNADFRATKKLTFNMDGSELTPSSKYDFKFKDYSPEVFRELRSLFGIDPADYLISITGKYILSELGSPGKSGSFFYYSRDFRFIIKTIHHAEHKQLRRMLKDYYEHVKSNPNTLISQFYGLHRLKVHGGMKKVHFIVMNNLFPPHRDIHYKYDLKGSTWGRATTIPKDSADLSQLTLKDLNWLERHDKIKFGPDKRKFLTEQLEADVKLLKKINVMDYSFLLGVHDVKKGNTDGKKKLSVFDPKSSVKAEVIKTNPRDIDRGVDLPTNVFPGRSKYIFYGHDGGIRATNENNEPLPEIYYLGIIDCLTNYSTKKRFETFFRSLRHARNTISAIPSKEYGDRFLQFMTNGITREKSKTA